MDNPPLRLNDLGREIQKMNEHNKALRAPAQAGKTSCVDQINGINNLANEFKILYSLININEILKKCTKV